MGERQDFIALEWVAGEIGETLNQAAQALEAYIANRDDATKLRFCLTHIHQVYGTLQMVEFFGAALLAEEMEGLAHALTQGTIHESHIDDALTVLQNTIVQLPKYLERVKESKHGLPATLLPVLNDLRAVRGESLLSETVLFAPDMSSSSAFETNAAPQLQGAELAEVTHKLRQMYQIALLGFLRGQDVRKNLNYLAKVCARLAKVTDGGPSQALWKVCIAALEGLLNGSIDPSVAVKILLRQVDRQIKLVVSHGESALQQSVPEDLLKNILYYVARSKANSKFIKETKAEYNLDASLLGEDELGNDSLVTPDNLAMQSVVEALALELSAIKDELQQAGGDVAVLTDVLPLFRRVNDTMAILGMGSSLKLLQQPYSQLARLLVTEDLVPAEAISEIISQLTAVEAELNPSAILLDETSTELFNDSEEAQQHLDSAFISVLRESRIGLEHSKEAIIEFVATQWDHSCLDEVPGQLREIRGSLDMVPLSRAANVLHSCERYITSDLLESQTIPEWQMLDTLADAITSIDYYLERVDDDSAAEGEAILDVAEESVAELGYPVASSVADLSDAAVDKGFASGDVISEAEPPALEDVAEGIVEDAVETEAEDVVDEHLDSLDIPVLQDTAEENTTPADNVRALAEVIPLHGGAKSYDGTASEDETAQPSSQLEELQPPESQSPEIEPPLLEPESVLEPASDTTVDVVDIAEPLAEQDDQDYDPEIVEIFIEEAGEVLDTIDEYLPQWAANVNDDDARSTIRRAFHTLKGSGRMVGATDIGELAWSIENMLNRVLEGTHTMDQPRFDIVTDVKNEVPALVKAFEDRTSIDRGKLQQLMDRANALSEGQTAAIPAAESETIEPIESAAQAEPLDLPVLNDLVTEDFAANSDEVQFSESPPPEDDVDNELIEIFATETATHSQVLDNYITRCRQLAGPAELTDELQRALHTLKGSANMAGVVPVAQVVTPIEFMVKELRASQLKADQPVVDLLERGSLFIKAGIEQLQTTPMQILPGVGDFIEELGSLLDERLTQAANAGVDDGSIPPEALNQFLTRSLDCITDIAEKLAAWQRGELSENQYVAMEQLVDQFIEGAEAVNMLAPVELAQALQVLYRRAATVNPDKTGTQFFTLAAIGNDALIDMLDQIAGHQNPEFSTQLMAEIQDFEFEFEAEREPPLLVDSASAVVAEIEFDTEGQNEEDLDSTLQMPIISDDDIDASAVFELDTGSEPIALSLDSDVADDNELDGIREAMLEFAEAVADSAEQDDVEDSLAYTDTEEPNDSVDLTLDIPVLDEPVAEAELVQLLEPTEPEPENEALQTAEVRDFEPAVVNESASTYSDDDDEFDEEIKEIFLEEADDLLEAMDEAIHGWSGDKGSRTYLDDLLRILHTLKGGARLAGITELGNLSHNIETYLIAFDAKGTEIDESTLQDMHQYQDQLITQVAAIKAGEQLDPIESAEASPEHNDSREPEETSAQVAEESEAQAVVNDSFDTEAFDSGTADIDAESTTAKPAAEIVPFVANRPRAVSPEEVVTPLVDLSTKKGPQEVVKVSAQLLDELVNLAGETSISRGRAEEQISELVFSLDDMQITVDRLQEQVRRLDMETEQQILYRQEQVESEGLEGFDPLEMDRYSQLQQLSRSLLESSSDLVDIKSTLADKSRDMETLLVQQSRINTELQEGLMRSQMVPFARMVPRLRRIIRQVSGELNKKVDFHLDNVEGELDRSVLERMVAPLEHMLRNAVDHGIETADIREAAGKPKRGNVSLDLNREGGEIVITLSDDGAGINLAAVRKKAVERGLMEANAELSDHEISQFILQAGFSTATEVTQISGRGVGMDVVHSEIKQLGGSMDIDSVAGKGSRFTVRLPFTVSVNRALMVNISGDIYAIPLNTIEGIVRVSPFELEAYYQPDAPMFEYAGQPYLLRYMGALLQRGDKPNLEGQSMPLPVILVRGAEHSVAVQVDNLMGSREIVVKPLGPQFNMVQGLSGATVLGDGSVVVILDLLAMIRADALHMHKDLFLASDGDDASDRSALVMVVDDSVTVRKVTSRFLERQGMEVLLAKDGVDAITQLQEIERIPDVMLLDIEMPRMDGFEVASRVRHHSRLKDIPIIMITSRTGEKHRERALSLGVNDYMGKPYQETALLETIQALTGASIE